MPRVPLARDWNVNGAGVKGAGLEYEWAGVKGAGLESAGGEVWVELLNRMVRDLRGGSAEFMGDWGRRHECLLHPVIVES